MGHQESEGGLRAGGLPEVLAVGVASGPARSHLQS